MRTFGETVDASQVATCESLTADWQVLGIVGSGHPVGGNPATGLNPKGTLPEDVALRIDAGEVLVVNLHMINVTDEPIHACYKQNLYGIPDAAVKREGSASIRTRKTGTFLRGQLTTDEMCMFRATYWPRSVEMDWCMAPGSSDLYSASRLIADGRMDAAEFVACWNASPQKIAAGSEAERFASQRCFTESCAAVAGRVMSLAPGFWTRMGLVVSRGRGGDSVGPEA